MIVRPDLEGLLWADSSPYYRTVCPPLPLCIMALGGDSVWKYSLGVWILLIRTAISKSLVLDPIYWNSSNPK